MGQEAQDEPEESGEERAEADAGTREEPVRHGGSFPGADLGRKAMGHGAGFYIDVMTGRHARDGIPHRQ
ncbi:hypothetical protein SHKM778_50230 [Streptomyces sp. KM77-8]|uniref:Uncharacterized protein n=1 Tax=Streptomyces haneummycinicus TaxID=3074435 RepID=A0AAT9HMQ1_9ACTN